MLKSLIPKSDSFKKSKTSSFVISPFSIKSIVIKGPIAVEVFKMLIFLMLSKILLAVLLFH
ncbi:hypothetical protein [Geotoga petraea]|uniref:hypothetical protein n=1 Tax=Geotoga petraea TaxID=28234 RepID=UPI0015A39E23|nr:hypothetical protein [Geotoga petraea]